MIFGGSISNALLSKPFFFSKTKASCFKHQPLDESHIRLIQLHPGSKGDSICCSLQVVNLLDYEDVTAKSRVENLETYDAVSYVWGSPKGKHRVMCNGMLVHITSNVKDVLERLRDTTQSRTLWLDALCIDQSNPRERAEQVKLMGLVYWKARHVHVWLGRNNGKVEARSADLAVKRMRELGQLYRKVSDPESPEYSLDLLEEQAAFPKKRLRRKQALERYALHALFERPWFRRVWVVQELGLSRDATFYCSEISFTRDELDDFMHLLQTRGLGLSQYHNIELRNLKLAEQYRISTRGSQRLEIGSDQTLAESLLDILEKARGLECTDRRDSVYAFLGHPAAYKRHLTDDAPYIWYPRNYYDGKQTVIQPDYSVGNTFLDVYQDIATTYMRSGTFGLDTLFYVAHDERTIRADFPSWIPRWDLASNVPTPFQQRKIYYDASGRSIQPTLDFFQPAQDNGLRLRLKAVLVDTVICTHNPTSAALLKTLIDSTIHGEQCGVSHAITLDLNTLAITLTAGISTGRDLLLHPADADIDQHCERFCAYLGFDLKDPFRNTDEAVQYYSLDVQRAASHRVLLCTEGTRLGLGPRLTRKGDQVWLILGANMPFILRELSAGIFKILGPVYLHGAMRGEMAETLSQNHFRTIEIR
ncbi:hypothetical protein J1614_007884 [Plenodomus biglobosus]|nr:hypothetical protein J1614_007884 [Plenodomus biglobosus]